MCLCEQEQVSGGTTSTVLRNLLPDTSYKVTVVPVYPEGEGLRLSDQGQTRKSISTPPNLQHTFSSLQGGSVWESHTCLVEAAATPIIFLMNGGQEENLRCE